MKPNDKKVKLKRREELFLVDVHYRETLQNVNSWFVIPLLN